MSFKSRKKQEEYWDRHAEDDLDSEQKYEIDLSHWNPGLPVDTAISVPLSEINNQINSKPKIRLLKNGNREIHLFWFMFREKILHRDNYTCVDCGSTEDLNVHHILEVKEDPSEEYSEENCITLCSKCHKLRHKKEEDNSC